MNKRERNKILESDLKFITDQNLPWKELENKSILITGAGGFLPSYMVETILYLNRNKFKKKAKVIALEKDKIKIQEKFSHHLNNKYLKFIYSDVSKIKKIDDEINFIIHAASPASPKLFATNPVETLIPNIIGTKNLLDISVSKKIESFLFFSSGEIYGNALNNQGNVDENIFGCVDTTDIRSCYAESKRMGENMCVCWFHQYGVPAKIVRPFHIYGPGFNLNDGRVFADFVADVVNDRDIIIKSDGQAIRSFCYSADATVGFFSVLLKGTNGEAYNVGNDEEVVKIVDLAKTLTSLFPQKKLQILIQDIDNKKEYLKSKIEKTYPDISKIKKLGWKPKFTIREGFKRTIKSYLYEKIK